ncbi:MAG: hypothetical protein H6P99_2842 [Holophagaceae bacterium]|nr:hypothetical protein [Holophagaceae bacterium]
MLTEAFTLVMQLPPLAFGPAWPGEAFRMPRELTCPARDLGRIQATATPPPLLAGRPGLDPRSLRPTPHRHVIHPAAEFALLMGAMAAVHGTWDDRTWSTRAWDATGAVTPVLIPPQVPPMWDVGRR